MGRFFFDRSLIFYCNYQQRSNEWTNGVCMCGVSSRRFSSEIWAFWLHPRSPSGCRSPTPPHSSALSATVYLVLASTRGSYRARRVRVLQRVRERGQEAETRPSRTTRSISASCSQQRLRTIPCMNIRVYRTHARAHWRFSLGFDYLLVGPVVDATDRLASYPAIRASAGQSTQNASCRARGSQERLRTTTEGHKHQPACVWPGGKGEFL